MTNNQWTGRWISNTHRVFAEALKIFNRNKPDNTYLLKVNNRNTRKRCEICSKLTIKTSERDVVLIIWRLRISTFGLPIKNNQAELKSKLTHDYLFYFLNYIKEAEKNISELRNTSFDRKETHCTSVTLLSKWKYFIYALHIELACIIRLKKSPEKNFFLSFS